MADYSSSDDDLANVEIVRDDDQQHQAAPLVAPQSARPQAMLMLAAAAGGGASAAGALQPQPQSTSVLRTPQDVTAALEAPARDQAAQHVAFLARNPRRVHSHVFVGFTQHGKSSLVRRVFGRGSKGSDDADDEARGMTTRCRVHSAPLMGAEDVQSSMLCTAIDTPGEPSFAADASAGISLAGSAGVLCVDCVEGLHPAGEAHLRRVVAAGLQVRVVITKIDRLIVELRLPPRDAFRLLRAIVDQINASLVKMGRAALSVAAGEVVFVATKFDLCLSLPAMARKYAMAGGAFSGVDPIALAKRLWGSTAFDPSVHKFVANAAAQPGTTLKASFVEFVLEPVYKLFAETLCDRPTFTSKAHHTTAADAVRDAIGTSIGAFVPAFVDALLRGVAPAHDAAPTTLVRTVARWYAAAAAGNSSDGGASAPSLLCTAPIMIHTGEPQLRTLVRVESGVLKRGQAVSVCNAPDAVFRATVKSLAIRTTRGAVVVDEAGPGVVVMVEGLADVAAAGTSVLFADGDAIPDVPLASRVLAQSGAAVRVAVEPIKHTSLPEMQAALQTATQLHAGCSVHAEDTGDHVLVGSSELYLDVVLRAVRSHLGCGPRHPIRLTDPYVAFCETVAAGPRGMLRTASNEHGVSLAMVAGPASRDVTAAFDSGRMSLAFPRERLALRLEKDFGWDPLEATGLVACGPDPHHGPSFLIDDTLGDDAGASGTTTNPEVITAIAAGFRAAVKRGPLCGEVVRGVKLYLVGVTLPETASGQGTGLSRQVLNSISALARQVVKAALLSAAPRLVEPHLALDIVARPANSKAIEEILLRRRGGVTTTVKLPATQLVRLQCVAPVIDAFGLDTELRTKVGEHLLATSSLAHWSTVPGDPLDDSVNLLPLQAASGTQLARDFMLKTRRRKGLPDTVAVV